MSQDSILPNLIRYQITWFSGVLGVAHDRADLGAFIGFLMIAMHFRTTDHPLREYKTVLSTLVLGLLLETLLIRNGWVDYGDVAQLFGVPIWLWVLWAMFGSTLNGCLRFFRTRPLWSCLFGVIGGPLAWLGGESLGALQLSSHDQSLWALALGWGVLLPILTQIARGCSVTPSPLDRPGFKS